MVLFFLALACGLPLDPAKAVDSAAPVDSANPDDSAPPVDSSDSSDTTDTTDTTDTAEPTEEDDPSFLFGEVTHDLALTLDEAALAALAADPREDVVATLLFDGRSYQVGVHLKGSTSFRDLSEKASFKIDAHEWDEDQRFFGLKRLTLNNMIQDPTMSSEHLSYALHDWVGNPSPRHGYARLTVNGELFGLYGLVETPDDDLIERLFPDDDEGNLYEGGYGGDFNEGRALLFEQSEGEDIDHADLEAVIRAVESSTPETFTPLLASLFDLDALLRVWAVERVTGNADSYVSLGNNFFVYHAPLADQWTMLPWGADQAFLTDELLPADGALAERCEAAPDCAAQLKAQIEEVLEVWEAGDFAAYAAAETARIENDCRTDPRSEWGDYGCRDALIALNAWISDRPAQVRAQLVD
jgi:spore coat protein CotH